MREPVGSYHERPVLLQSVPDFDSIAMSKMDHAAVLLWLGDRAWNAADLEKAVERFLQRGTLHLTIAGARAGDSFGVLMETVSVLQGTFVTVLNVLSGLDLEDSIQEFLKGALPAENQMKAWTEYQFVLVAEPEQMRGTVEAAVSRCGTERV